MGANIKISVGPLKKQGTSSYIQAHPGNLTGSSTSSRRLAAALNCCGNWKVGRPKQLSKIWILPVQLQALCWPTMYFQFCHALPCTVGKLKSRTKLRTSYNVPVPALACQSQGYDCKKKRDRHVHLPERGCGITWSSPHRLCDFILFFASLFRRAEVRKLRKEVRLRQLSINEVTNKNAGDLHQRDLVVPGARYKTCFQTQLSDTERHNKP